MKKGIPFVSIIIPAFNEEAYISECLNALADQTYPKDRYEVIVVDNGSIDRTKTIASKFGVILLDKERGPVGAVRNFGATEAKGDIFAFLDADCVAPTDWIERGVSLLTGTEKSVFGGGYKIRKEPYWMEKFWLLEDSELPKDLLGGSIFITRSAFFEVGMFNESITSGEDTKLSESLREAGYSVLMSDYLSVVHLGNPITISHFIKRQIWHSENYLQDIKGVVKDPTFYLIIFFLFSVGSLSISVIFNQPEIRSSFSIIVLLAPAVLSAKRITRSKCKIKNLRGLPAIYTLDFLYLVGRSVGLIKSFLKIRASFTRTTKS